MKIRRYTLATIFIILLILYTGIIGFASGNKEVIIGKRVNIGKATTVSYSINNDILKVIFDTSNINENYNYAVRINNINVKTGKIFDNNKELVSVKTLDLKQFGPTFLNIKILIFNLNYTKVKKININYTITKQLNNNISYYYKDGWTFYNIKINKTGKYELIIPKNILKEVNKSNFKSNLPYKIINKDPLIAWDIDQVPTNLGYGVKNRIPEEEISNMKIKRVEEKTKAIMTVLLLTLLTIIIANIFIYSKKKKK